MNYQFSNLLGAPYRGGNLLLHGNDLLAPVGNRVSQVGAWLCRGKGGGAGERGCPNLHLDQMIDLAFKLLQCS